MSYICDCEAAIISFAEAFIAAMYGAWPYIIFMIFPIFWGSLRQKEIFLMSYT